MPDREMYAEEKEKIINAIGSSWDDFERETFTNAEIVLSDRRVEEFLQRFINDNNRGHEPENRET